LNRCFKGGLASRYGAAPPRGTFFSDLDDVDNPPQANQPWEVNFAGMPPPPFFVNPNYPPTAVAPTVYLLEDATGRADYHPIPGVDIVFILLSDP
jgi:hypothetical protein